MRIGRPHHGFHPSSDPLRDTSGPDNAVRTRSDRIRAFRASQMQSEQERMQRHEERMKGITTAVHLLSAEEAKALFTDIAAGLAFLVGRVLHL